MSRGRTSGTDEIDARSRAALALAKEYAKAERMAARMTRRDPDWRERVRAELRLPAEKRAEAAARWNAAERCFARREWERMSAWNTNFNSIH